MNYHVLKQFWPSLVFRQHHCKHWHQLQHHQNAHFDTYSKLNMYESLRTTMTITAPWIEAWNISSGRVQKIFQLGAAAAWLAQEWIDCNS